MTKIPIKISQLTALALKDKVLTLTEKRTIIEAAINEGMSEQDITAYLDNALRESLKNYTKEQLKRCPHCGAQVPLISNDCLFCGNSLVQNNGTNTPPPNIWGIEADIINRENQLTADQLRNLKQCPDCGAPFPLISNICSHCGHILHEQTDSALNINALNTNIQNSIKDLKNAPKPTVIDVLKYRKSETLFVVAAMLFLMGFSFLGIIIVAGTLFMASIVALFFAFKSLKNHDTQQSPAKIADDIFYDALHSQEMYSRQVSTLYGGNSEAQQLLQSFSHEINSIKNNRNKNRNILTFSVLGIFLIAIIAPMLTPSAKTNYEANRSLYPQIYANTEINVQLKPLPQNAGVEGQAKQLFKADSYGELSFDLATTNTFITYSDGEKPLYKVRVSNIKLLSTGNVVDQADSLTFSIAFWDKDCHRVCKEIEPQITTTGLHRYKDDDNMLLFLERSERSFYADFVTTDNFDDFAKLQTIADNAVYYSIY